MKIFVAKMKCKYCDTKCHKKGKRNRRQQYQCPVCYSYQKQNYVRNSLKSYDTELLIKLNNEGLGIRSIGRVLNIPKSTVSKLIFTLSKEIKQPTLKESAEEYEVDELPENSTEKVKKVKEEEVLERLSFIRLLAPYQNNQMI